MTIILEEESRHLGPPVHGVLRPLSRCLYDQRPESGPFRRQLLIPGRPLNPILLPEMGCWLQAQSPVTSGALMGIAVTVASSRMHDAAALPQSH